MYIQEFLKSFLVSLQERTLMDQDMLLACCILCAVISCDIATGTCMCTYAFLVCNK